MDRCLRSWRPNKALLAHYFMRAVRYQTIQDRRRASHTKWGGGRRPVSLSSFVTEPPSSQPQDWRGVVSREEVIEELKLTTPRARDVLDLMARGYSARQAGKILGISEGSVSSRLWKIRRGAMGRRARREAAEQAAAGPRSAA